MNPSSASYSRPSPQAPPAVLLRRGIASVAALIASACAGGGGSSGSTLPVGSLQTNPATGLRFVVDANQGGQANSMKVVAVYWGRLVDVLDSNGELMLSDFLIGDDVVDDGFNFDLERNPVTEKETLTILRTKDHPQFPALVAQAESNVQSVLKKSLDPGELPPFTAVPRNSAIAIVFDDLIDDGGDPGDPSYPGAVNDATVRLTTGYPPSTPYEARILPDPNHGDLVSGRFHSTRVLLDLTVSELESLASAGTLNVNSLGLPEPLTTASPNGGLRLPTRINASAQQFEILTNLSGGPISFTGNGPTDPLSPTLDVVRAFRSGGKTSITGDPHNGFLPDQDPPQLLGSQVISVTSIAPVAGATPDVLDIDLLFNTPVCATSPLAGDVVEFPSHVAQVEVDWGGTLNNGFAASVRVRVLSGDPTTLFPTLAQFKTAFTPASGHDPRCFVRFLPQAGQPPSAEVSPDAQIVVTFSEPMEPTTVEAFGTFTLQYGNPPSASPLYRNVVGHIVPSQDLKEFTFEPEVPLNHPAGDATPYTIDITGVSDLAGNPLAVPLPATQFTLDPAAAAVVSGSIALKFGSLDEDGDGNPEVRGQFLYDVQRQAIKPRAVARFSAAVDTTVPTVGAMVPFTQAIQTPLSNHGSKMMGVWRYHDAGFALRDESAHNLDVEGLYWAPFLSGLFADNFSNFQMSLAHSRWLPDEELSTGLLPNWPQSGLVSKFEDNLLDKINEPLTIVHDKALGYSIQANDAFQSATGLLIVPWPMNRNIPSSQFTYWTWRDTSKIQVAGPNGSGADTGRLRQVLGTGSKAYNVGFYTKNNVPTIGLPLLMEFRTYADTKAQGQNGFKIAIAINSSARPYFRAFSTGGVHPTTGATTTVNPDTSTTASGGINPNTGNSTWPLDNAFYYGQGDFLVRISRVHTCWFDTLGASVFRAPVVEPGPSLQPTDTFALLAFRGATAITPTNGSWSNAEFLDPYGDSYTTAQATAASIPGTAFTPSFFHIPANPTSKVWKSSISDLNGANNSPGARYVQARISFIANPETQLTPLLSAIGFAFTR
jgi:hypothetical protein